MLSLAMVDSEVGKTYYAEDNYYTTEESLSSSSWWGKGAQELGLAGVVETEPFHNLLEGKIPGQAQLKALAKRRGALDLTFSAPKSVSLAALVLNDERLLKAHEKAVSAALQVAEARYANTRCGSNKDRQIVASGNLIAARFNHTVSRALDPQLHTHCVLINSVKRSDGKWRAFHTDGIYRNSKLLGLVYQNELARECLRLGYEVEKQENGTFELKGFLKEQLLHFSKRRKQILDLGGSGSQKENRELVLKNRPKKEESANNSDLRRHWRQELGEVPSLIQEGQPPLKQTPIDLKESFRHASAHEVSFIREKAEAFALQERLGEFSFDAMSQSFQQAIRQKELLAISESGKFTTEEAIQCERTILSVLEKGRNVSEPVGLKSELPDSLSAGQRAAVSLSVSSQDRFMLWQGVAGAGKTFALKEVKAAYISAGYTVSGFAPSSEAAKVLASELSLETTTVARKLVEKNASEKARALWIIDEAGLLSARDCEALMQRAEKEGARVLMIGDSKQLASVGAGNAFKLLQQNKAATAYLTESRRQKTEELKKVVSDLSQGTASKKSLEYLDSKTALIEDKEKCIRKLVKDYMALSQEERHDSLVLAGRRDHRRQITNAIRSALVRSNEIQKGHEVDILRAKDLTEAEIKAGFQIKSGDFVSCGSERAQVQKVERTKKIVLLKTDRGQKFEPFSKISGVFEKHAIKLAPGERVVWTKNDKKSGLSNGTALEVLGIAEGHVRLKDTKGRIYRESLSKPLYLDYNYVNTVYASQGKTCKKAFIFLDNAISREGLYVAVSRAKYEVNLYATGRSDLKVAAEKSQQKESAIDSVKQGRKRSYRQ